MKKRNLLVVAIAALSCLFISNVNAATLKSKTYTINEGVSANSNYTRWIVNDEDLEITAQYIKLSMNLSQSNKGRIDLYHTNSYFNLVDAVRVATTGTISASDNTYTIYYIPENMSCPDSNATCYTIPSSITYSKSDLGLAFQYGFNFVNESWFYGHMGINGTYTIYYY